eukprot:TRINITY_DN2576_c0_g1::TRINITY_DN2576_c0_g1_i1::g.19449::m.19449 TRINITY_DN2576_c0_g1::TRINITY_DN2576_c0_g1_i1::g.19449  ORF type:complete len:189 (-),score=54.57,sp/O95263/PDE8B_HUMAN/34.91/6e-12,PDEase_I/PF00233.14/1.5e-17 TRINITY_DN2576_c0_g1_i1:597-1118(-)
MLLKAADIGNVLRSFLVAEKWATVLSNEFFSQGDTERRLGMTVTPSFDRQNENNTLPASQVGFYTLFCLDFFTTLVSFTPEFKCRTFTMQRNYAQWCWRKEEAENTVQRNQIQNLNANTSAKGGENKNPAVLQRMSSASTNPPEISSNPNSSRTPFYYRDEEVPSCHCCSSSS